MSKAFLKLNNTSATLASLGKPLEGTKLIDMTAVIAGPYTGMQLAELGMEVIKLENADGVGDSYRYGGSRVDMPSGERYGASYASFNRGKRSIAVNSKSKEGQEIVKKLVKDADVFLQNMRPGVMERLGLNYEELKKVNPNLIYVSISGYGSSGPMVEDPVYDPLIQARSGFIKVQERVAGTTTLINSLVHDKTTAMVAVQAIIAALFKREFKKAGGTHIEIAMLDVGMQFLWGEVHANNHYIVDKKGKGVKEQPNIIPETFAVYPCKDGHIAFLGMQNQDKFSGFCRAFAPWMETDPRFAQPFARFIKNLDEFKLEIGKALSNFTKDEIMKVFRREDIPGAPALSFEESYKQPQAIHNEITYERFNEKAGVTVRDARLAPKFDGKRLALETHAPLYAEHSVEILKELGYSEGTINDFAKNGVIQTHWERQKR